MTMRTPTAILGALSALALATTTSIAGTDEPQRGPVYVETTEILYLESFPVQVELLINGALPTPCHEPAWEVAEGETSVDVTLWSTSDPELLCATVLEPVQLSIPLGSYESADLDVTLDGEIVGRIELVDGSGPDQGSGLDPGSDPDSPGLTGAGWSFGMCLGYCRADLRIDGTALTQTGHDRESEAPLYENHGDLTAEAVAAIDSALVGLDTSELLDTYGCPDCADGGAAYLALASEGNESRHDMDFGSPPEQLEGLYELSFSVMAALESCTSNELVTVAERCVAYRR